MHTGRAPTGPEIEQHNPSPIVAECVPGADQVLACEILHRQRAAIGQQFSCRRASAYLRQALRATVKSEQIEPLAGCRRLCSCLSDENGISSYRDLLETGKPLRQKPGTEGVRDPYFYARAAQAFCKRLQPLCHTVRRGCDQQQFVAVSRKFNGLNVLSRIDCSFSSQWR